MKIASTMARPRWTRGAWVAEIIPTLSCHYRLALILVTTRTECPIVEKCCIERNLQRRKIFGDRVVVSRFPERCENYYKKEERKREIIKHCAVEMLNPWNGAENDRIISKPVHKSVILMKITFAIHLQFTTILSAILRSMESFKTTEFVQQLRIS